MTQSYHLIKTAILMLGLTVGLAACSDETVGNGSGGGSSSSGTAMDAGKDAEPAAADGTIEGSANYTGAEKGPLVMSVFAELNMGPPPTPKGMPAGIATVDGATWPGDVMYSVKKVKPGDYYVFGYISVGVPHFMGPQGKDPRGLFGGMMPMKVTVKAGEVTKADFKMIDLPMMPPGDGGTDGGDAGP